MIVTKFCQRPLAAFLTMVALILCMSLVACREQKTESPTNGPANISPAAPDFFADVTDKSPALQKFICRNGEDKNHYTILETLGAGVGVIDFDGDGLLDLVFPGGGDFAGPDNKEIVGLPTRIFKNMGDWTFTEVTDQVLPNQPLFYSHGVAVADYDRDGWPDLLVTGYGRVVLYRNMDAGGGKRKFVDVTKEAGLLQSEHFWSTSAAFADLDGDGWPDLYLCQYVDWSWKTHQTCPAQQSGSSAEVCQPEKFNARQHALFRNNGKGGFVEVTREAKVRIEADDPDKGKSKKRTYCGNGLGVLIMDLDGDGKPDIYVANDGSDNFLYLNQSKPGQLLLEEVGQKLGVATDPSFNLTGSMGVDAADIDGSGLPALWVTNFEGQLHSLYRMAGEKKKHFFHNTVGAGLGAIGKSYVGWGTGFVDLDNDGRMDLAMTNGHVFRHPAAGNVAQMPVLFLNKADEHGKFQIITDLGGPYFRAAHKGRGLAVADLNNDGRPDLIISHVNEPPAVLQNICATKNNWLGVQLAAPNHADVVGARAVVTAGARTLTQFQKGGGSYLSARDPRLLFGLGKESKVEMLTVHWPTGEPRLERWEGLEINKYHKLAQGTGKKVSP